MPANKNAMTRYKILDELLSSRYHNYSLDDLTEEVSNRLAEMYPNTNGVVSEQLKKISIIWNMRVFLWLKLNVMLFKVTTKRNRNIIQSNV